MVTILYSNNYANKQCCSAHDRILNKHVSCCQAMDADVLTCVTIFERAVAAQQEHW